MNTLLNEKQISDLTDDVLDLLTRYPHNNTLSDVSCSLRGNRCGNTPTSRRRWSGVSNLSVLDCYLSQCGFRVVRTSRGSTVSL
jgi:hypothetical protein